MSVVIITGSNGLVGSEAVNFFCDTQEAKKTVSIRASAFFISMIFKIFYKLT